MTGPSAQANYLTVPEFVDSLPKPGGRPTVNPIPSGVVRTVRRHPDRWLYFADVTNSGIVSKWRATLKTLGMVDLELAARKAVDADKIRVFVRCTDLDMKQVTP